MYTLQFAICTKSTELFKLYSKEKTNLFCVIKLLFIKVRCLINVNVSLEANLEGQGCVVNNTVYHLLVLTWGLRYF